MLFFVFFDEDGQRHHVLGFIVSAMSSSITQAIEHCDVVFGMGQDVPDENQQVRRVHRCVVLLPSVHSACIHKRLQLARTLSLGRQSDCSRVDKRCRINPPGSTGSRASLDQDLGERIRRGRH